jgi:hypothetical protein
LNAKNESCNTPATAINLQIARAYLNAADPGLITRTWQEVMEALVAIKRGTRPFWQHRFDDGGVKWCAIEDCRDCGGKKSVYVTGSGNLRSRECRACGQYENQDIS